MIGGSLGFQEATPDAVKGIGGVLKLKFLLLEGIQGRLRDQKERKRGRSDPQPRGGEWMKDGNLADVDIIRVG